MTFKKIIDDLKGKKIDKHDISEIFTNQREQELAERLRLMVEDAIFTSIADTFEKDKAKENKEFTEFLDTLWANIFGSEDHDVQ